MATAVAKQPKHEPKVRTFDLSAQVLELLGKPPQLFKVETKHLFNNVYRVNVRCHGQSNQLVKVTKIAHSYFLITNSEGKIVKGDEIVKVYE